MARDNPTWGAENIRVEPRALSLVLDGPRHRRAVQELRAEHDSPRRGVGPAREPLHEQLDSSAPDLLGWVVPDAERRTVQERYRRVRADDRNLSWYAQPGRLDGLNRPDHLRARRHDQRGRG